MNTYKLGKQINKPYKCPNCKSSYLVQKHRRTNGICRNFEYNGFDKSDAYEDYFVENFYKCEKCRAEYSAIHR